MLSISTNSKRLFRGEDINDKDLAGYFIIRWLNEWVQLYQIYNNDVSLIYNIAKELLNNNHFRNSSIILIKMWEGLMCKSQIDSTNYNQN